MPKTIVITKVTSVSFSLPDRLLTPEWAEIALEDGKERTQAEAEDDLYKYIAEMIVSEVECTEPSTTPHRISIADIPMQFVENGPDHEYGVGFTILTDETIEIVEEE